MQTILSLVIPVYNVEKYIKRCLDSVFQQIINKDCFEVIVVNDGTPDNSMNIVNDFASRYSNLKIINQENKGLSAARNSGLSIAQGEYIWFIDSDDWISNNAFETILPNLDANYLVIATNLIYAHDDSTRNFKERELQKDVYVSSREYFDNFSIGAVQRYIIKRDFLVTIKLFFTEGIYHEDAEFGSILIYRAQAIFVIKDNIYYYYQREHGSIMSDWKAKNTIDYLTVFRNLSTFQNMIVSNMDKDFFSWHLFRLLVQAFPLTSLNNQVEIKEIYINRRWQLRQDAFSCLKFNKSNLKRSLAILTFIFSPLLYFTLLRSFKKR